jgi:hypothetical protein
MTLKEIYEELRNDSQWVEDLRKPTQEEIE